MDIVSFVTLAVIVAFLSVVVYFVVILPRREERAEEAARKLMSKKEREQMNAMSAAKRGVKPSASDERSAEELEKELADVKRQLDLVKKRQEQDTEKKKHAKGAKGI